MVSGDAEKSILETIRWTSTQQKGGLLLSAEVFFCVFSL